MWETSAPSLVELLQPRKVVPNFTENSRHSALMNFIFLQNFFCVGREFLNRKRTLFSDLLADVGRGRSTKEDPEARGQTSDGGEDCPREGGEGEFSLETLLKPLKIQKNPLIIYIFWSTSCSYLIEWSFWPPVAGASSFLSTKIASIWSDPRDEPYRIKSGIEKSNT